MELFHLQLTTLVVLLAIGAFSLTILAFTHSWSFFAYSGKERLLSALRDCKQRSLTVNRKVPTVGYEDLPNLLQKFRKGVGGRGLASNSAQNTAKMGPQDCALLLIRGHRKKGQKKRPELMVWGRFPRADPLCPPAPFRNSSLLCYDHEWFLWDVGGLHRTPAAPFVPRHSPLSTWGHSNFALQAHEGQGIKPTKADSNKCQGQKGTPKNLCDKDFADFRVTIGLKTLILLDSALELFRKFSGAVPVIFWRWGSFWLLKLTALRCLALGPFCVTYRPRIKLY